MSATQPIGPATRKVLAMLEDLELDALYPNRTYFVDAQHPHQALMISRALFSGDPSSSTPTAARSCSHPPHTTGSHRFSSCSRSSGSNYVSDPSTHEPIQLPHAHRSKSATPPGYLSLRSGCGGPGRRHANDDISPDFLALSPCFQGFAEIGGPTT
jgi:hypothetical protein